MKKKPVSKAKEKAIRVSDDTHRRLVVLAERDGRTVSESADRLLREALDPSRPMTT